MVRMGHDSERAVMIYQHQARGADQVITGAIDALIEADRPDEGDADDGAAGRLVPGGYSNCTLIARMPVYPCAEGRRLVSKTVADLRFWLGAGDGNRTRTISLGS
jgi:hypothetical protein